MSRNAVTQREWRGEADGLRSDTRLQKGKTLNGRFAGG